MEWEERKAFYNKDFFKDFVNPDGIAAYLTDGTESWLKEKASLIYDLCEPLSILNCGCANGWLEYAFYLLDKPIITGFDVSEYALSIVADAIKGWVFQHDITEGIPFENDSFELVVILDVLEHLHNYPLLCKSVSEICRIATKGILVMMPLINYPIFPGENPTEQNVFRDKFLQELNVLPHEVRLQLVGVHPYLNKPSPNDTIHHPMEHPRQFWVELFKSFGFRDKTLSDKYYIYPNALGSCSFNIMFFEKQG